MNAIMPSMGSRGMSGIGAPPIQSPSQNPQGMPQENMGQIMALARKMSDMQLADVLSGKNMDVPQFAAMTEAMGRRSLRNAMKGAQAQGQLQKPNLKQQTLAELQAEQAPPLTPQMNPALQPQQAQPTMTAAEGGLASLPAPNMESMDMAAGGIVAFADPSNEQEVRDPNKEYTVEELLKLTKEGKIKDPLAAYNSLTKKLADVKEPGADTDILRKNLSNFDFNLPNFSSYEKKTKQKNMPSTPNTTPEEQLVEIPPMAAPLPNPSAPPITPAPPAGLAAAAARPVMPPAQPAPAEPVPPPAGGLSAQDYDTRRKASMEEAMSYFKDEIAGNKKAEAGLNKIRTQGSGEALMLLAAAISGTPNMTMAMAKGLPLVAAQSASVRKELDTLQGKIDDRNLALKKATKAYEQGDMKSYTDYMDSVSQADYRIKAASNGLITANASKLSAEASKLSAEASMVRATSDKATVGADSRERIALGDAVRKSVDERLKTDYKFRTQWDKMSSDQKAQFYKDQMATLSPIYGAKMPAGGGMNLDSLSSQADAILKSRQPK